MKELKINQELKDFIPPLSGEEKKQLEDSLLKYGYKGAPIYTWHDYIVDGHNRYELCRKHNINYPIEELDLGEDATIIDVMEWMINTQLGRRNLPPAQRLAVMDKFKKKIQEHAKENQSLGGGDKKSEFAKNRVSPIGEKRPITHTDKELAKLVGVGTGTIARYNRVMNSDDEELKRKVLADEVKINAGQDNCIETNIRQRGNVGGSAKKVGLRIKELERIYGIKVGNPNYEKNSQLKTQTELADDMGMDVRTLQNYKMLADMIPEFEDLSVIDLLKQHNYD